MGLFGFGGGSDNYSKSYLLGLGKRWGIDAEAGHLIEKGYRVQITGNGMYTYDSSVDVIGMDEERQKLTRSIKKHLS